MKEHKLMMCVILGVSFFSPAAFARIGDGCHTTYVTVTHQNKKDVEKKRQLARTSDQAGRALELAAVKYEDAERANKKAQEKYSLSLRKQEELRSRQGNEFQAARAFEQKVAREQEALRGAQALFDVLEGVQAAESQEFHAALASAMRDLELSGEVAIPEVCPAYAQEEPELCELVLGWYRILSAETVRLRQSGVEPEQVANLTPAFKLLGALQRESASEMQKLWDDLSGLIKKRESVLAALRSQAGKSVEIVALFDQVDSEVRADLFRADQASQLLAERTREHRERQKSFESAHREYKEFKVRTYTTSERSGIECF